MADTPIEQKELSIEDMIEEFGKDDETPSPEPDKLDLKLADDEVEDEELEKPDKKAKKDEDEKDEEEEEKLDLKKDEELEDEFVTPPRRQEILKAYPDLFKKFPYIEKSMYREQEYTQLFGSLDDAKEVKQRTEEYAKFEDDLLKGDIGTVLSSLRTGDEDAFANVVDNLLPTLNKIDNNAYNHLLANVIKGTLLTAIQSAPSLNESDASDLRAAASIIHQFVFGPGKFIPPHRFSKSNPTDQNPEAEKLNRERAEFTQQTFESHLNNLTDRVDNLLKNTISSNIDPRNTMTSYVKRGAIRDTREMLDKLITRDSQFQRIKDRLWEESFKTNFSRESLDKIRSAYLSKAKTLLPSIIKKIRAEALNSRGLNTDRQTEERPRNRDNKLTTEPSPAQSRRGEKKEVPKGMSTLDYLNSD